MSSDHNDSRGFPEPIGHAERIAGLWRSAESGRLPHALLARGPRGIGKFAALRWLALGLHCATGPGAPCRTCGPCKRILSGNHPDHFELDVVRGKDKETAIKVEHIAEREGKGVAVGAFLRLRPSESSWRTVIVREAERMNEAAQNAFLKTLEEPAPGTLLLIECSDPKRLLPTVHSRVVALYLERLSGAETARVLERQEVPSEELELLTRWCRGAPGRALEVSAQGLIEARALLVQWLGGDRGPSEVALELLSLDGKFAGKTPLAKLRAQVAAQIELALDLLADLQRVGAGVDPDALVHGDVVRELRVPVRLQRRFLDRCLLARQDIEGNLGPEATLERALDPTDSVPMTSGLEGKP